MPMIDVKKKNLLFFRVKLNKYLARRNAAAAATMNGGAQSTSVIVLPYPSVALRVGKYALNDKETTLLVMASDNHQTFQSASASLSPWVCPPVSVSF